MQRDCASSATVQRFSTNDRQCARFNDRAARCILLLRSAIVAGLVAVTLAIVPLPAARGAVIVQDNFSGGTPGNGLGGTLPSPTPNANTSGGNQLWYAEGGVPDNQVVSGPLSFPASYSNAPTVSGNSVALAGNVSSGQNVDRIVINSSGSGYSASGDLTTAYYSLLVSIPSAANLTGIESFANQSNSNNNVGGTYNTALLASLSDSSGATGSLGTQIAGVYLSAGSTPGTVDIGIGGNRNGVTWRLGPSAGADVFSRRQL